jgi:hypothetical protein
MATKFNSVTVLSYENGQAFQCRANEIESADGSFCTVNDMRTAPVRVVLRDDANIRDISEIITVLRAFSAKLMDGRVTSGAGTSGYVP